MQSTYLLRYTHLSCTTDMVGWWLSLIILHNKWTRNIMSLQDMKVYNIMVHNHIRIQYCTHGEPGDQAFFPFWLIEFTQPHKAAWKQRTNTLQYFILKVTASLLKYEHLQSTHAMNLNKIITFLIISVLWLPDHAWSKKWPGREPETFYN